MREIWKPIVGYKRDYEVSNFGRVRRGKRWYRVTKYKDLLTPSKTKLGNVWSCSYPHIDLYKFGTGKCVRYTIHKLVLLTFRGLPKKGQEARHLNGIKTDNRVVNLKWGTRSENNRDFFRLGGIRGFNNPATLRKAVATRHRNGHN